MIRIITISFFLFIGICKTRAQDVFSISEAEAKSADKKIHFKANTNTSNYDITYHKLEFSVDPTVASISGKVTTTFTALQNMNSVTFDLDENMTVSAVTENGNALTFSQNTDDELIINLQNTLNQGKSTSISITYSGNPTSNGFGSFEVNTHNGTPILWTLSEPYGALGWWPCKQDLNDKIDAIDVYITTPQQYVAVSNGLEQSAIVTADKKTTHFKHQYPIPAYLIAIAVTNYETYSHTVSNNGNPFPILNYVYPESLTSAQNSTGITVDIMNHFIDLFGNYPFENEKYGHAQFGWGGGMEHTTVSFMGGFSRDLIAHELAHQWFGNKITCGSWKDIWLNEGFATFLTGLSIEKLDGETAYKNWRSSKINSITSLQNGAVYLSDVDTTSVGRIFNSRLSYNKGAMVLHMLRKKLGDINFFQGLKNYISDPDLAYSYAKTPDLIAHLETVSNLELYEFFNDWIYNQGYPTYNLEWNQQNSNTINITLNQTQSDASVSFFEANVPVRVNGTNGEILDLILDNKSNNETFVESVSFLVSSVDFDPETHLISKNNTVVLTTDNQVIASEKLELFPNPVHDFLTIKPTNNLTILTSTIYTLLGKKILETKNTQLNLSQLKAGIYIIKVDTNSGILHKKIIKN
ncbi:M1 family aminopeptidase [uncultured Polaribacter sp.]|uniref:M1 family aminopeptidase n=1 Tax=uncultured Polaribacter sp. TaxID=174711 RepID=UPI0030DBACA8|tara:strand:- start:1175 stop:3088 length:1914 start_codon:yes stop_codon:yes gene_type:complete